jgi:hypothetical protein
MQPMESTVVQTSSCPGLSRASTSLQPSSKKDVDGRDEPGHDEEKRFFLKEIST